MNLGSIGVWSSALRRRDAKESGDAAREVEHMGYSTIWIRAAESAGLRELIMSMMQETRTVKMATGIISIWTYPAAEVAAMHAAIQKAHPVDSCWVSESATPQTW